jgi:hypothetical protein
MRKKVIKTNWYVHAGLADDHYGLGIIAETSDSYVEVGIIIWKMCLSIGRKKQTPSKPTY